MKKKVLVVEDEQMLREAVTDYFLSKSWEAAGASCGAEALNLLKTENYDLVLLDVMMPGMDGFAVCRHIREFSDVPVIFLTARVLEEDQLKGYAIGGDDYVTKPFSMKVLFAKACAIVERRNSAGNSYGNSDEKQDDISNKQYLKKGTILVDCLRHLILVDEQPVELPYKEYEMLVFFMKNPGIVFSREQLLDRFWGPDFDGNDRVVDNHIKKLRKALGKEAGRIITIPKAGYQFH